jgi:uncharacterized protein YecE (DUF72 family)
MSIIRVGIGGWTFEPWRGVFYPKGLPHARELEFASREVTAIEVNATFYRTQRPEDFRRWAAETPDDFVFSLKAPRYAVNRKVLAEARPSIDRFIESGIGELKNKLGPILWQFAPTKRFEEKDFGAFLGLLPREILGRKLRHVVEVRHQSFLAPEFVTLAREAGVAVVIADHDEHPLLPDVTSDFIYARLQRAKEDEPTGYPAGVLATWAKRARAWAGGGEPDDLKPIAGRSPTTADRDVFIFMINGEKVRAPAAAKALIGHLKVQ